MTEDQERRVEWIDSERPEVGLLRGIPLFQTLNVEEIAKLEAGSVRRVLQAGNVLYEPGRGGESLYVVASGTLVVNSEAAQAKGRPVAKLRRGDICGELGFLEDTQETETASALEYSAVVELPRQVLMAVLDSRTEIVAKIRLAAASKLGTPAADARGALRYRMHLEVGLRWEEREPERAELIDLSPFGACLKGAPEEWGVGDTVRFTLDWKEMKLPLVGRVVWSEGTSIGLTFTGDTGLRSPSQDTLAELLDRFV